jgi:DNA polymerase
MIDADLDTLRELELLSALSPETRATLAQAAGLIKTEVATLSAKASPASVSPTTKSAIPGVSRVAKPSTLVAPPTTSPPANDPARVSAIKLMNWNELDAAAKSCKACVLCHKRQQAVPGIGARNAPWLFIGEGPGEEEDRTGEPFVGQAGKLLDAMLAAAGLQRGREVFIANVVKCRPPGNRTPLPEEAAACAPFLDRQIELIQPKLIVALGKTAITRLTGLDTSMASLRQKLFDYRGIAVVATYHPSYLLRNLPEKSKAWEDLLFAKKAFARVSVPA